MFNLFGSKPLTDINLPAFQNSFDRKQKAAVLSILIIVSTCDGGLNSKEELFLENIAGLLGLSLSDPLLDQMPTLGKQKLSNLLNTLDKGQKEWLLMAIYELIHCDGKAAQIELNYASGIAGDLGYSENQYLAIIDKSIQLRSKYR